MADCLEPKNWSASEQICLTALLSPWEAAVPASKTLAFSIGLKVMFKKKVFRSLETWGSVDRVQSIQSTIDALEEESYYQGWFTKSDMLSCCDLQGVGEQWFECQREESMWLYRSYYFKLMIESACGFNDSTLSLCLNCGLLYIGHLLTEIKVKGRNWSFSSFPSL